MKIREEGGPQYEKYGKSVHSLDSKTKQII